MKAKAMLCLALSVSPSIALAEKMPVVGLDINRRSFAQLVPAASYIARLQDTLNAVHRSLEPVFDEKSQACAQPKGKWRLRTVAIGVSGSASVGLGSVGGVTFQPRFRLVYTNSINPTFPD